MTMINSKPKEAVQSPHTAYRASVENDSRVCQRFCLGKAGAVVLPSTFAAELSRLTVERTAHALGEPICILFTQRSGSNKGRFTFDRAACIACRLCICCQCVYSLQGDHLATCTAGRQKRLMGSVISSLCTITWTPAYSIQEHVSDQRA